MKQVAAKKKTPRKKPAARKLRRVAASATDYYGTAEFAEKLTAHFFAAKRFALGYAK